jgi:hypothetical protein
MLCRTLRLMAMADQRPWSSPLDVKFPVVRSKRAATLSTVRALRTSAPIREADEVIGSLRESATVRSDCDGAKFRSEV